MAGKTKRTKRTKKTKFVRRTKRAPLFRPTRENHIIRYVNSASIINVTGDVTVGASQNLNNGGVMTLSTPAFQNVYHFGLGLGFCLDDCTGVAEFTALYQKYKILGVILNLIPISTVALSQTAGVPEASLGGWVHSAWDTNDNTTVAGSAAGVDALRQYQTYKVRNLFQMGKSHITSSGRGNRALNIAREVFGNLTPGYEAVKGGWLNTATADIVHYGYKQVIELMTPSNTAFNINFKLECKYLLAFTETQ